MKFKELQELLSQDFQRSKFFEGSVKISRLVTKSYRIGCYFSQKKNFFPKIISKLCFVYARMISLLTGIQLPFSADIQGGLLFPHFSCIVLTGNVKIGRNCTIHQGVTIGRVHNGKRIGVPEIGDNVVIYPGANVSGHVKIGNNVVIGANAVVVSDVPDGCVVAGVPAKIISTDSANVLGVAGRKMYWCVEE